MPPQETEGGVFIPTSDIYAKLILAIDELHRITVQLEATRIEQADKETRIRALERWKYGIPPAAIASAVSLYMQFSRAAGK